MIPRFVVTGTDTGIGKTIFAAALTGALNGSYWKPVQSGLDGETDRQTVERLGGVPRARILPEAYRLSTPVSPHFSARRNGVTINSASGRWAAGDRRGSGAAGAALGRSRLRRYLRPLADPGDPLRQDVARHDQPHAAFSQALKHRAIPVFGLVFIGDENNETQRIICEMGSVRPLGRLPWLPNLDRESLRQAFRDQFDLASFVEVSA
ncbi:dethiobiotin synthetase [Sinorhizobium americanum]|uniref:Dethiobiotin synthetase n=1 Tax=Sinorhizobium americanum TaxID=194963 RepID=A0A4R2B3T0_9HYPH|nr:dethiobiotin synthetase [Sinorhizobium americanum]